MNPDLSPEQAYQSPDEAHASIFGGGEVDLDDIGQARANEYALLASLLLAPPDQALLARISGLDQSSDSPLGRAHGALAQAAASASADNVQREYSELFIGVGRGELLPYASYYLTGFLNERPLARLRGDMNRLGIARADDHFDPEDHLGTLCEIMSGMAANHFEVAADEEQKFFTRHIAPWARRFFDDLENANAAGFYRAVGAVGKLFVEIEIAAFAMEARQSA